MGREDALKDYITVNERVLKFYDKYPEGRITSEIVSWIDGVIVMKSYVYRDSTDVIASTGFAYEKENSTFINKTSALENAETSAVGRALALLGFEIKKSIASYEEVANAKLNQNTEAPATTININNGKITDGQAKRLYGIGYSKGYDPAKIQDMVKQKYHIFVNGLTIEQYNYIVSKLEELPDKK